MTVFHLPAGEVIFARSIAEKAASERASL